MDLSRVWTFFNWKKVLLPIIIGLGFTIYIIIDDFDITSFKTVKIDFRFYVFILAALIFVVLRDVGYILRIRLLTGKKLSFKASFQVIMLWEFASSITPSVVGGSAIAAFILNAEKIKLGRSTSIVMVTAFLDELFYVIAVPAVLLLSGFAPLFSVETNLSLFGFTIRTVPVFVIGYIFIVCLILIIGYAIFINPVAFKKFVMKIFNWKLLKKWKTAANTFSDDLVVTSDEFKKMPFAYWFKAFSYTVFSWTSRFLIVNMLILAFGSHENQFFIFAKQLVMWVILLISPTPGGSGIAELTFSGFFNDVIQHGIINAIALIWRMLTYYPYIILGLIILPYWVKRVQKYHLNKYEDKK